eukprot:scaffold88714_cov26-Prasinocladus_malaysianus.AAC.1
MCACVSCCPARSALQSLTPWILPAGRDGGRSPAGRRLLPGLDGGHPRVPGRALREVPPGRRGACPRAHAHGQHPVPRPLRQHAPRLQAGGRLAAR